MKKDWRERELTMEVLVGAFIVMIFLGLGYFTIILSKEAYFRKRVEMHVRFDNVMGLSSGDQVVARGMPVGKVKSLKLAKECCGVLVTLQLDESVDMHEDYKISIVGTSILGGRQLQISEGTEARPTVSLALYEGRRPYDLMDDAAAIVNAAREGLVEGGAIEHIQQAASNLSAVVSRIAAGEGTLGRLLGDDGSLYDDFSGTVASLREVAGRLERGEGSVGQLLADDGEVYKDLAGALASLREVSDRVASGTGTLGRLLSEDDDLYDDLRGAVAALRKVSERLVDGEGALGKVLTDDRLYNEVTETVTEIRAVVDDLREASPVSTFSSIFFGAL
jgi:phospholipid/cholesterol/gamma-HCH transport system substrate-binding protein